MKNKNEYYTYFSFFFKQIIKMKNKNYQFNYK